MSQSGSSGDVLAARLSDIGKLAQELEDANTCEESMSIETSVDINKDVARLSHLDEVSDVSNVQSDCPLGSDIKVDAVNGSLDGTAMVDDTTEEAEEPPDGPTQNVVVEAVNRRTRRACLDEVDENNSKDESETRPKEEKPTKLEDSSEESRNSKDTNLSMNGENSKRRKLPVRDEEYNSRDFTMTLRGRDEESAEKCTRRKGAKASNGKKPTIASSSKAKSVELVSPDESKDNPVDSEAAERICIDDSDILTICDDSAASRSRNNRPRRRDSAEVTSVYPRRIVPPRSAAVTSSVYPRRIIPPRSGGEYAGRRARKPPFEIHRKEKTLTKVEDLTEESRNSKDRNLDMNGENSKRRKLPVRDEEYDWRGIMTTSSGEEGTEKSTRRKEPKVSIGKKSTTASSSKSKSVELVSTDESMDTSTEAKLAFEQTWREKMKAIEKKRQTERIKSNSGGPRQGSDVPGVEAVPESLCGMKKRNDEVLIDNRRRNLSQREQFPCPICSENFPAEEIEFHAAGCEQYDEASSAGGSGSNSLVVPMSLGTSKQRDTFSNMAGTAGLHDREIVKPTSRKKLKIANEKNPPTASSSRTKIVELLSNDESDDNLAEAKSNRLVERRIRDEAATRRRVDRVKQRLQEESKKVKLEERNEKLRLAFEQSWREKLRAKRKVRSVVVVPENHSEMKQSDVEVFSDDSRGNRCQADRVLCPICSKNFSIGDIEVHAAHCEQYDGGSSPDVSRSDSPVIAVPLETPKERDMLPTLLVCNTCSNFTTRNGRELEDHIVSCLGRQIDDVEGGNDSIVTVSNSPVVPASLETPEQQDMLSNMPVQAGLQDDEVAEGFENDQREIVRSLLVDSSTIESSRSSSLEQQKEEEAKLVDLEEQRVRDEETSRSEAERVEQRVQDAAKNAKLKELKDKRRLIIQQTCREEMREREKPRQTERIESSPEGPSQVSDIPSTEVVPENHSGMKQRLVEERNDDMRRNLSQTEQVPCPICCINFPIGEIETHAAHCVQFVRSGAAGCSTSNSPVVSMSSRPSKSSAGCSKSKSPVVPMSSRPPKRPSTFSTLLKCYICSKFTGSNGWEFEDHVTSCLARHRELRQNVFGERQLYRGPEHS